MFAGRRKSRTVEADESYSQIGIRSHGKGVFHKESVSGFDLGKKKVFWMEPGDFVINIVFGWEGAVALLGESEAGMIASHRFPTFRADESRLNTRFLLHFCKTPAGLDLLGCVSPGGAGRNRTLSKNAFLQQSIPLPSLAEQRRIVARIEELAAQIHEAKRLRKEAAEEAEGMVRSRVSQIDESLRNEAPLTRVELLAKRERGSMRSGPFGSALLHDEFVESGIPAVGIQDVQENRFVLILLS